MRQESKTVHRATAAALAAVAVVATGGVASAQIPGQHIPAQVFPVDDTSIQLTVDAPDIENATVSGTIQNNTDNELNCTGIDGGPAVTVTRDEIVAMGMDHWANYPHAPWADLEIDLDLIVPSTLAGSLEDVIPDLPDDINLDLGSISDGLPGSVGDLFWPGIGYASEISGMYNSARLAGQTSVIHDTFTVPANESVDFSGTLGQLSQGEREDFTAGVIATCEVDGQRYIFAGYQDGVPAISPGGTSGSLSAGSLGSTGSDAGSAGS